jgi:hypothetical protein
MRQFIVIAAVLFVVAPAFAHKLIVVAEVVGDQMRVEAYHDDDTPAQEAKVTVLQGEAVIAEGRTDEKGVWTFPKPSPGSYVVQATSVGHKAATRLDIPESPSPPPEPIDRSETTRTPWRRLGLGIGIIAGMSIVALILRRSGAAKSPKSAP